MPYDLAVRNLVNFAVFPSAQVQENCKIQREGVRSMFSGNDFW